MDAARAERFYARHAAIYDATRRLLLPGRTRAVALLGVRPGDRAADFACGTGLNVPLLLRAGARSVVGIDVSEAMLRRARRRAPRATFLRGDVAVAALPEPVDRALCTYGLSAIDAWEEAVRAMRRALAPGGRLVVLDFHPLAGAARPLDRPFACWLFRFGVDPAKPIGACLARHFARVAAHVPRCGYRAIWVADAGPARRV